MPPLQVPTAHQFPAQHRCPPSPHDWQVPDDEDDDEHTFDCPQYWLRAQHAWPFAPQGRHVLLCSEVYEATHELKLQLCWPAPPQGVLPEPEHDPDRHLPEKMLSQSAPCTTQVVFRPQQPPPRQTLPWQHGSPGAPQLWHVEPLHTRPPAEHTFPAQHGWPSPPQVPHDEMPVQVAPFVGQVAPRATQTWLAQQPPLAQALFGQHGWPGAPQAVNAPFTQTVAVEVPLAPGGMQRLLVGSRHEPPRQGVAPGHGGRSAEPHPEQVLSAVQVRSASHAWPIATQRPLGPTQPEVHRWSEHTGCPGWPHGSTQVPASPHATPAPVQRPNGGQQAWPVLPQVPQLPFMHWPLP